MTCPPRVRRVGAAPAGAMIALWLALDAPARACSVVAIRVPAAAFGAKLEAPPILARPGIGPLLLGVPWPPPAYQRIVAGTMGQAAGQRHPDLVRATYRATHRAGCATTVSTEPRELIRHFDAQPRRYALGDDEPRGVTPPALVLWGECDTHFQPIEVETDERSRFTVSARASVRRRRRPPGARR